MRNAIVVKTGRKTKPVCISRIIYAESFRRLNVLHISNRGRICEDISYYGGFGELEEELPDNFFRVHKGYIVNMKYVSSFDRREVWLKNGESVLISKYRYDDFKRAYDEYAGRKGVK